MLRLEEFQDLFEMPKIFASKAVARGGRLGIVTITGAVGVVVIDEGAKYGVSLTTLSSDTREALDGIYQGLGTMPVDIGPMMAAVRNPFEIYANVVEAVAADRNVDMLFNVVWANPAEGILKSHLKVYERIRERIKKPIATWIYGPSLEAAADLTRKIEGMGFPVFNSPEKCVRALGLAWEYKRYTAQGARETGE
jgi:acyl-CoA synthetase (NDP forming)